LLADIEVVSGDIFLEDGGGEFQIGVCNGAMGVLGGHQFLHDRYRKLGAPHEWRTCHERGRVRTARLVAIDGPSSKVNGSRNGEPHTPHAFATGITGTKEFGLGLGYQFIEAGRARGQVLEEPAKIIETVMDTAA
jgi:hypothetical protein